MSVEVPFSTTLSLEPTYVMTKEVEREGERYDYKTLIGGGRGALILSVLLAISLFVVQFLANGWLTVDASVGLRKPFVATLVHGLTPKE